MSSAGKGASPRRVKLVLFLGGCLFAGFLFVFGVEFLARYYMYGELAFSGANDPVHQFDETMGWVPLPKLDFAGDEHIRTNAHGFRDSDKEPDLTRPRIMMVGDSYTWGYQVEEEDRFMSVVEGSLGDRCQIFNCSVIGYSTDQQLLLLRKHIERISPDLVVLQVCNWNDWLDNAHSAHGIYAKPYFEMENGELALRGVPVPKLPGLQPENFSLLARFSWIKRWFERERMLPADPVIGPDVTMPILREFEREVRSSGADFMLLSLYDDERLLPFEEDGVPVLSMQEISRAEDGDWNSDYTFPFRGNHWNVEGNRKVAEALLPVFGSWIDGGMSSGVAVESGHAAP